MTSLASPLPPVCEPPSGAWWTTHVAGPFRAWVARVGWALIRWADLGPTADQVEQAQQAVFRETVLRRFEDLIDHHMDVRRILDERYRQLATGLAAMGASVQTDVIPSERPAVFAAAQPLRLLAPDGALEAEMGWSHHDLPVAVTHHERVYRRRPFMNEDGHWEFVRA